MNLNSRLRQLERIIDKQRPTTDPEPMGRRLLSATPIWQLKVLADAQKGRLGEDGVRIVQLFSLISVILESHVQSSALPGDAQIPEILRIAATNSPETTAVVEELRERLGRYGEPDMPGRSSDDPEDPFRFYG